MAFDAFLIFDHGSGKSAKETKGETTDDKYKDDGALEIMSFSFGAHNSVNIGSKTGGAGAGKADLQAFSFTHQFDTSLPPLFQTLCQGGHYDGVRLELRKAGAEAAKSGDAYAKINMKMVLVESIQLSGSEGSDAPMIQVSLRYGAIQVQYRAQDKTGGLGPVAEATWSQVKNKEGFEV